MSQAKSTTRRRRSHAISNPTRRRRHNKGGNPFARRHNRRRTNPHHRARTRIEYRTRYRTRADRRHNPYSRRRHNPVGGKTTNLVMQAVAGAAGAVGSRLIPQLVLGGSNTGMIGYGANIITGLALSWGARKFVGKEAGHATLIGVGIALVLRLVQDFTPYGPQVSLSGIGDLGVILPSGFVDPALFTGQGAQRVVPGPLRAALAPPPAAPQTTPASAPGGGLKRGATAGMGASTYGFSTYGR